MIGILGKKLGMTRVITEDGVTIPVTVIEAGPCHVLQVKTDKTDGYKAIQMGFGSKKKKRTNKPLSGHVKKAKLESAPRFIKEIRTDSVDQIKRGEAVTLDIFQEKDLVDISGVTIGKGFQGGVKRWGWKGGKAAHGSMHGRQVGSLSASSYPSRIFKGRSMPGHMGARSNTIQNLEIVKIDKENNLMVVKGAVPGHKNSYLIIKEARKSNKAMTYGGRRPT